MTIRQILLIGHTHHDVGYTNSPRIIDAQHARIVDRVLELAAESPADGPDGFRWTFEVARPVLNFLRTASPAQKERLAALAKSGTVSVTGGYLNMTQLPSTFEFDAAYAQLAKIRDLGIEVRTQQHGDVNGLSWGTVDQMRDAGIGRLVMALNPDHGRAPFVQPSGFWWEAPSGRRVFVWLSTHYGFGEEWGIVDGDADRAEQHIEDFVRDLESRDDYPWTTAVVHAGNDNRWPTALFLEVVRTWNARHPELLMRTATIDEALDDLEEQATDLPVPTVRGEWADWWSHGHGSTAREVAVYREARSFARAAQASLSLARLAGDRSRPGFDVLGYRRGPVRHRSSEEVAQTMGHIDEQLLLYGEHTWGSWETYSKPHSTLSHSHHNAKAGFAYDAFDHARDLAIEGWFRYVGADGDGGVDAVADTAVADAIVVVNPTESRRTEVVDVEVSGVRRARLLADVGPFGILVAPTPDAPVEEVVRGPIAVGRYRVIVDPARGGIVSLIDSTDGRELVDATASSPLGALVDERVVDGSVHPMIVESPKLFHPEHPGPDFRHEIAVGDGQVRVKRFGSVTEVSWETATAGIPKVVTTLVLAEESAEIGLDVWLTKPERFEPESVFVAFPFEVRHPRFLLETAGAVFEADREQLPDTSKDWYSIQHAVGITGTGRGMLWGSMDAPLVQVGGFHTGKWAEQLDVSFGQIGSWLMNNLHFTNFQARQEITRRFRYRFRPVAEVTAADVGRYGRDLLEPLQARHLPVAPAAMPAPPIRVSPAEALLVELRPVGADVCVRVRNISESDVTAEIRVDGDAGPHTVEVAAFGVADVVIPGR
ncbi:MULTISPECIES: hypothetical protein [unclassified Microbacterium]|uniref:glycoside hydrolase family 38 N-terminal domain-containing protein n=1 Tax=unclassified Microbacterium TaxID=2609290 RepID=UPI000EA9B1E1|nr:MULTISPECIES: hypothetical protein [unclassified Microbacterium]MBT2483802.1 hypothetical protein [Microbacterium sp. ISL-108]RKN66788.1 hypothetical protein D7252_03720 [Microbacterium sp. CGR2]